MAEGVNRPSTLRPRRPDAPEQVGADPIRPQSSGEPGELLKTKKPLYKRPLPLAVAVVLLILGAVVGVPYYNYAVSHEWTDDAFIEGHIVQISSKVAGHVLRVHVADNQLVKRGDLLLEIEPREHETRLAQARAASQAALARQEAAQINVDVIRITSDAGLQQASAAAEMAKSAVQTARAQVAVARSRLEQARAQIETAQANAEQVRMQVAAVEAEATRANTDGKRAQELRGRNQIAQQDLDHAIADTRTANAQLAAARKKVAAAEAQVAEARAARQMAAESLAQAESQVAEAQARVSEALGRLAAANAIPHQVAVSKSQAEMARAEAEQARAAVEQVALDLSYAKIYAPESGRVTRKVAEAGSYVQVGQALMVIVPSDIWVVANFKETQLAGMRPGQPAEITVDAYPDKVFKGRVDSIQTGTGARFSLLPPENATGNFVKVVQRVPVKILFDEPPDPDHLLGPGMSVLPVVRVK